MKKSLTALLLAAALTLTLAACGEKTNADTPLPDEKAQTSGEVPAKAPLSAEWLALHADDVLLRTEPFTLCEGRTATLELYGYQNGEYDCGVSRIHLLWDDGGEQELRTADVGDDVWCTDGYTNCWTEDGGLAIGDYNFDGYTDLGLQIDTPAYNLPYYYWFYDAETDRFVPYRSWTCQLEIDEENKTCICQWHVTPEYYTDTYRPDGEGGLYLARRDTEIYYSADGVKSFTEVYAVNEQPLAYADLDRDGEDEILVLTTSEPDGTGWSFYTLDAKKYDGTALFTEEFGAYHGGWNTLFLVYGEDENGVWGANLLRYLPFVGAGVGNYSYDLLSYAGGQEQHLDGNAVTFVLEADGASPVPDIDRATQADFERFREDVTELLRGNVTLLFSTDPVVCADLAYPMDGSYTEQAVENILSDLDAQALWLYPADAKGA